MVRSKPGLINCFRLAGVVKILETLAIFTCLMMHRIGAIGTQVRSFIVGHASLYQIGDIGHTV